MYLNVLDFLEASASKYPNKPAFIDENDSIEYQQLLEQAKSIGSFICAQVNNTMRQPVVVLVDQSVQNIRSFFAILYSGNFYVPIDCHTPPKRLEAILNTLDPLAVIFKDNQRDLMDAVCYKGIRICLEETAGFKTDNQLLEKIRKKQIDIDPAYAIFTSGSTGIPKGVAVSHKSLIDLTLWLAETFGFSSETIIGNQTPLFFDASVKDLYITVKNGATMHLLPKKLFSAPIHLIQYLNDNKVNTILWATSAIRLIANFGVLKKEKPQYLEKVFFAGEAMPAKQLNIWRNELPDVRYVNLYGPTEVTVDCTYYEVNRKFEDSETIPIGQACKNMEILLLDLDGKPVEKGTTGEIYVRGTGVALGYYNHAQRTKESFVQNPMHSHYPDVVYRTGDFARYNEYGELVFVSREDGQVKHMGNRIELGEIESAVNAVKQVEAAVCFYDGAKEKIVLAYQAENLDNTAILKGIGDRLPKYMYPNILLKVNCMPETANGKINRIQLQEDYYNGKNNGSQSFK